MIFAFDQARAGAILFLVLASMGSSLFAAEMSATSPELTGLNVQSIRISGNFKTRQDYILDLLLISPGQPLSANLIKGSEQRLRNTDLFKTIEFSAEKLSGAKVRLYLRLEEKRYTFILPRLGRNRAGDIDAGFRIRLDNLQGAAQSLDLLLLQEDQADGDASEEMRLKYTIPSFNDPFEYRWRVNHKIEDMEINGFENVETTSLLSIAATQDLNFQIKSVPLSLVIGAIFERRRHQRSYPDPVETSRPGDFNRINLGLIYDDIQQQKYRRVGRYLSLEVENGLDWLGSDYDASILTLNWSQLYPLNSFDSLNYRINLAAVDEAPFDYALYTIGGADDVRGLEDFDARGNARIFANFEYVFGYRRHPNLRHSLFFDAGNVYDQLSDVSLSDLQVTVGTGFRWKIKSFVKTDLILDYGYHLDSGDGRLYGSTSLIF